MNQTDPGFLSSILNDDDLQLMDMAMNDGKCYFLIYFVCFWLIFGLLDIEKLEMFEENIRKKTIINNIYISMSLFDYLNNSYKVKDYNNISIVAYENITY